ncbi:TetR/AcrR family transcriptional regulator [Microbacterium telephonicum]|uniref:TetR family transcriptional regulator n=1 Tax=Microbacterium telephonicum TaxID=1714841 RepID=A0A498CIA5_9MICO|nr:TetR/AcrR family transcriptional regulator [Microbacterium telephonicum]RLK52730.1 TetR family transcriptional regulator [Microbacterium telephonicum]
MGRSRTFVEDDAAHAALGAFWSLGYEAAAVPDLERATGLSRSSIYHSFGSKRGLFDAVVNAYLDVIVRPRLAPLRDQTVSPHALEDYLAGLRAAMATPTTPLAAHGCLLLNTATSTSGDDAALVDVVRAYREELSSAIARGVGAARPELSPAAAGRLATACTAHVVAAMTLVRADSDGAVAFLDNALELLHES